MRRLDLYIARELIGPVGLGFAVYTFIMLIRFMFQSTDMIVRRGVSLDVVGQLLVQTLPNILVLTIPMALLFGILTAVGRLSADSELVALRASGVSLLSLYRPILLVSGLLALLNGFLMIYSLPSGNAGLQQLRLQILSQSAARQVDPRVFYTEWDDKVLYAFETRPDDDRWHGVFLAQGLDSNESSVTLAQYGTVGVDASGEQLFLDLTNATTYTVDLNQPERHQVQSVDSLKVLLEDRFTSSRREKIVASKGVRELGLVDLFDWANDPTRTAETRARARVEIHKKFAIPAACLVFGLCALPLGFNNRRGGKASGFALSIGVILLYYVLINNGEEAARAGEVPAALAMWAPNILLTALGLFLLIRRNRDKSLMLSRIDRWIRQDLWAGLTRLSRWSEVRRSRRRHRRQQRSRASGEDTGGGAPAAAGGNLLLRIPRLRVAFPNLVDRYVLKQFGLVLMLVLLSAVSLYIIGDLSEKVDEVLKNRPPRGVVLSYYQYFSLQIFYEISPIVVLITTLITFSLLSRTNEITALKALGVSLFRLSVPVLAAALLVAGFCAVLQSEVLPATNLRAQQLEDQIMGRQTPGRTFGRTRQWLYGQGGYIYNYLHYDPSDKLLQRLQIFEVDPVTFTLKRRLAAAEARYVADARYGAGSTGAGPATANGSPPPAASEDGGWLFSRGWTRTFEAGQAASYQTFAGPLLIDYPERPEFFSSEVRLPDQMSYAELEDYIDELKRSGQDVPDLEVALHNKIARPVAALVMALVGLPFAFRLGRQGTLYGIGISIGIGMVFFAFLALFEALGKTGVLPPSVAAWSPGIIFSILSIYLFLGVRT